MSSAGTEDEVSLAWNEHNVMTCDCYGFSAGGK